MNDRNGWRVKILWAILIFLVSGSGTFLANRYVASLEGADSLHSHQISAIEERVRILETRYMVIQAQHEIMIHQLDRIEDKVNGSRENSRAGR